MQHVKRKLKTLLLGLCMLALGVGFTRMPVQADTITLDMERFTLGGGFIHEPETVKFTPGETYAVIINRALKSWGLEPDVTGSGESYYLAGVKGIRDCGTGNIPAVVRDLLQKKNITVKASDHANAMYQKDYTEGSGWMYTVDNVMADVGMGGKIAKDGEVVRLMFTLALGADLTGTDQYTTPPQTYYQTVDKSALMVLMAEANANKTLWGRVDGFTAAYADAVVMAQMNAGQNDVADAVRALTEIRENLPKDPLQGVRMKRESLTLNPGKTVKLDFTTTPSNAEVTQIAWSSDAPSVATVDEDGTVRAVAAGTTHIRVSLNNNAYSDSCTVTVKAAVQKLTLNATNLTLRTDEESYQLAVTQEPQDSYADLTWKSGNTAVVVVTESGRVIPVGEGEADITVSTPDNVRATCHVRALASRKKPFVSNKVTSSLTVKAVSSRSVQLSWNAYTCAESYTVYRRMAGNNAWTAVTTTANTTYTDTALQSNKAYYYYVKASSTLWGDTRYSKDEPGDCKAVTTLAETVTPVTPPVQVKYVSIPGAVSHTYTGAVQTGVAAGAGYTLSGTTSAVDAGTYTATATLSSGYAWGNGSTAPVTLTWTIAKAGQNVHTAVTTKSYTLKNMKKKAASFTIGASAQGAVSYRISRTPAGGGKYITVDRNGKVTLKKKAPGGIYEITVTAAGNANLNEATRTVTVQVTKYKQNITAKKKSVTYKTKDLKKKNKTYSIGGKAKGKITYRVTGVPAGGQGYVTVNGKGKVTVKKGAPKGTYTITLTTAENKEYAAATRNVTVRVK